MISRNRLKICRGATLLLVSIPLGIMLVITSTHAYPNEYLLVQEAYNRILDIRLKMKMSRSQLKEYMKHLLKNGTTYEKEVVLNLFESSHDKELVPDVIEAILDTTPSPSYGDTGGGPISAHAARAIERYAFQKDKIGLKHRGEKLAALMLQMSYSTNEDRRTVHQYWLTWWEANQE